MSRTTRKHPEHKYMRTPRHIGKLRASLDAQEQLAGFGFIKKRVKLTPRNTVTNWDDINLSSRSETRQKYYWQEQS